MIDGLTGVLVGRHILLGLAMPGTPTRSFGVPGYGLIHVLRTWIIRKGYTIQIQTGIAEFEHAIPVYPC